MYLSLYAHPFPSLAFIGVFDALLRVLKKYIYKKTGVRLSVKIKEKKTGAPSRVLGING